MPRHSFQLDKEFVELHVLLKLLGLAPSGGAAKALIVSGRVTVDGVVETRKGCKIRGRQVVRLDSDEIHILDQPDAEGVR